MCSLGVTGWVRAHVRTGGMASLQPGLILPRRLWCHTHLAGVEKLLECWTHPQFSLPFNPNAQQHPELEEKEEITF